MAYVFRLPDIGEGLTEAEVTEWLVDVGREVGLDQPLVQIETDKAVTDIPSPRAGVLIHRGAEEGSVVRVGDVLAVIGQAGEGWPPESGDGASAAPEAQPTEGAPIVGTLAEPVAHPEPTPAGAGDLQVLPLVRKLARDLGVDLSGLRGTGPNGRITRQDVEAAAGSAGPRPGEERVRLSRLRRTIARNMVRSWREIPHVTAFDEADAGALLSMRRSLFESAGRPLALEALFIRAVLPALRAHPEFNATMDGDDLVLKQRLDIGLAVDTPGGLIVAVVKAADTLDLWGLASEVARLAESTRNRTATVADVTGPTFTISNIGAVGGGFGTPIIPPGTTSILSFGRIEQKPVARKGRVEVAPMVPLSLSYDHRAIDGVLGRRFLARVIEALERPTLERPNQG